MITPVVTRVVIFALAACFVQGHPGAYSCNVLARTESGWVCGLARWADQNIIYASFRGVPYAKQPLGELRFQELQPVDPWGEKAIDATEEGPICYQTDVVYGRIMQPHGMSEECIHANIHVPMDIQPASSDGFTRQARAPIHMTFGVDPLHRVDETRRLPILVFFHGGGFQGGSGDADLHGPEYLVTKDVIVITFNYRLNVFGYLSLNSAEVPGNQALRDQLTLLRWVRRNAKFFGGDPDNVTIMGQSAGAVDAHLLTLSNVTSGLYKRAFLMSGTATSSFYSASPIFSSQLTGLFLSVLGINSTDPQYIHKELVQMPIEKIHAANELLLEQIGFTTFVPTVETAFPGVTRILDEDPEVLLARGRGGNVPLVVGFTNQECEVFRRRLDKINIAQMISDNPVITVPATVIATTLPENLMGIAKKIDQRYYNGTPSTDGFINYCSEGLYKYPAIKLAEQRASSAAPLYLYEFSYDSERSVLREALDLHYKGAAHIEDLTYMFRVNSILGAESLPPKDDHMKDRMTSVLVDFMKCDKPVCGNSQLWTAVQPKKLHLQDIKDPSVYRMKGLSETQKDFVQFFDSLKQK